MTTYGLIGTHRGLANCNPGGRFIVDGIRWLIRQIDSNAIFLPVEMMEEDASGWDMVLAQADVLLLCGNPRFNLDERGVYWDLGIWRRITQACDAGIPFIDAWAGAAHPFPLLEPATMAEAIASLRKTKTILSYESRAAFCIARDRVAEELLKSCNEKVALLPCSAWHAIAEHGIVAEEKDCHCITLRHMPGYPWIIDRALAIQRELQQERPAYILTHEAADYHWIKARRQVLNLLCISDASSLLRFYARVDKLLSFRIHASIPALSLGARVCNVSMDSRSLTVNEFSIPSIPFTDLEDPEFRPRFSRCTSPPGAQQAIDVLQTIFQRVL